MDFGLEGRRALVTGASKGIGFAIAEAFAREGCRVAIVARSEGPLAEAAAKLRDAGAEAVEPIAGDVATSDGVRAAFDAAVSALGGLDVLVNNAGGPPEGTFLECDDAMWREGFEKNYMSVVRLTRLALPLMIAQGRGRIVNVSSIAAREPLDRLTISNALRPGLAGLVRTVANEHAKDGVTINNVLPGFTATERVEELADALASARGVTPADVKAGWKAAIPTGRLADPAEIAHAVLFLASDAGSYVNGANIPVCGGFLRGAL